jgi:hypothetical protein
MKIKMNTILIVIKEMGAVDQNRFGESRDIIQTLV